MNALACVVHDLVTGGDVDHVAILSNLSRLERKALADLRILLRRPPRDLALLLARGQWPEPWLRPPPSPPLDRA